MNSRLMLLVSLALLLGASVLGYLAYQTTSEAQALALEAQRKAENSANEGKTPMVVLARPAKAFQVLSEQDLAVEQVVHPLPGTQSSAQALLGKTLMTDLPAGSALVESHFNPGGQVARLLRPGERAVAIPVNDVVGSGGFLQPGDIVDIILFLQGQDNARPSTQVVMRGVRVLSFGAALIDPTPKAVVEGGEQEAPSDRRMREARTAVLAVAQADVSRLMLANSLGELRLAIVPTEELRQAAIVSGFESGASGGQMLPVVDVLSVPSRASAVPVQRQYLTDSALQVNASRMSASRGSSVNKERVRTALDLGSSVVIIRGLSTESK